MGTNRLRPIDSLVTATHDVMGMEEALVKMQPEEIIRCVIVDARLESQKLTADTQEIVHKIAHVEMTDDEKKIGADQDFENFERSSEGAP